MHSLNMKIIGDYQYCPKDVIGHGAFAMVYRGTSISNPRRIVAIKSLTKKNLAKSKDLLDKEIDILQELTKLKHDNVVALLAIANDEQCVYLIMEHCNGGDLGDYLNAKGTLSEDTIRLFLKQIAAAMKALHDKGVIHRDLKPQNILLSHSGKPYPAPSLIVLKIADFGFARFLQDGVMAATLCGSPMYMAPEVLMTLQYDAKVDLWSIGTIIFQCLTGSAPFSAQNPPALKRVYEKNLVLVPDIPPGTSPELTDLLMGLLKRNAPERMSFERFFAHPFLVPPPPSQPVELPPSPLSCSPAREPGTKCSSPFTGYPVCVTPDDSDDFVLVPSNLPTDKHAPNYMGNSPPRPSSLPISMPTRSDAIVQAHHHSPTHKVQWSISQKIQDYCTKHKKQVDDKKDNSDLRALLNMKKGFRKWKVATCILSINEEQSSSTTLKFGEFVAIQKLSSPHQFESSVPRSQPINVQGTATRASPPDISSLSPPPVQYSLGTPPGLKGFAETPPPVNTWTVSPTNSPLRKSMMNSPLLSGAFASLNKNNQLPLVPFNKPLTENNLDFNSMESPVTFVLPELPQETLLEREHNETLAKLNFVLALAECITDLASSKGRVERLVLLVRGLQLLSSALSLATQQLKSGRLQPSSSVKSVVGILNTKFRKCLVECKKLNSPGLLQNASATADKILYDHAIDMCQSAALDELFGSPAECFQRYQTAQILLHALAQQTPNTRDKMLLNKYKEAVEKRLSILQKRGYIYSNTTDNI